MIHLLLATLLAAASPAIPIPGEDTKIVLTGDPDKDAPLVCVAMVGEKVDKALAGEPVTSSVIYSYSVAYKLTEEQVKKLGRDCSLLEMGFLIGVNAERNGLLNKAEPEPENKGLTTAF